MEKELLDELTSLSEPFSQKEEKTLFHKGIFKAKAFFNQMKYSFIHGKRRGETTRFHSIDPCFTWKKGFVHCWTGYPNHGKTEMLLQLSIAKSLHDGWNWVIFCPENMSSDEKGTITPDELFDTLIHAYIGKSTDPYYKNIQMSMEEYERGIEFVDKHYTIIYPNELKTPATVVKYLQHVIETQKVDGVILDPWNKMVHNYAGLLDEYLASQFAIIKDFAIRNHIVFNIVEHPKSVARQADGSLPVPDAYCLRGGAMWNNAMDVIISVHRPNYHTDKKDSAVDFISHKIKNQKLVGMPGTVNLTFERKSNRYFESDGNSPLHVIKEYNNTLFQVYKSKDFGLEDKAPF
jgi:hypothetical protein